MEYWLSDRAWAMIEPLVPSNQPGARRVDDRRVLAWRVSITLEAHFCIEAVEEVLARHGTPEIFNTDQASQFTSTDFIKVLAARETRISMDGKSAWRDNIFVERL